MRSSSGRPTYSGRPTLTLSRGGIVANLGSSPGHHSTPGEYWDGAQEFQGDITPVLSSENVNESASLVNCGSASASDAGMAAVGSEEGVYGDRVSHPEVPPHLDEAFLQL